MVTVERIGGLRVVIYPNDHRPAHVHVIGKGYEAVFKLNCPKGPPVLRENYGFPASELRGSRRLWQRRQRSYAPSGEEYMDYPRDELEAANDRAAARLSKTPVAVRAHYDRRRGRLIIDLNTGLQIAFKPKDAQGLEEARPEQLKKIEISPSGLGLYFPDLDADLYLPGLLEGFLGSKRWIAALMGKTGGQATSDAKAAAARLNGRKGGRPKKKTDIHDAGGN